jgi:hypothetical protein
VFYGINYGLDRTTWNRVYNKANYIDENTGRRRIVCQYMNINAIHVIIPSKNWSSGAMKKISTALSAVGKR